MKNVFILAVLLSVSASLGFGGAITAGNWYADSWSGGAGANVTDAPGYTGSLGTVLLDPGAGPFTFTGSATLFVTDLFISGDRFEVFDNLVSLGLTSAPLDNASQCGDDPAGCTDPAWSEGSFDLGAGSHSITLTLNAGATGFPSGGAAFELASVPEPATFALMGLGFLGIITRRKFVR